MPSKRGAKSMAYRVLETEWLAANRDWLEREHAGRWIAVSGPRLVAVGDELSAVMAESSRKGEEHPLVTKVREREYQGLILVRSPRLKR